VHGQSVSEDINMMVKLKLAVWYTVEILQTNFLSKVAEIEKREQIYSYQ